MRSRIARKRFHRRSVLPARHCWEERFACVYRAFWRNESFEEAILKSYLRARSLVWSAPSFAQKLVDPSTMAPQYREAAEKRRAEQNRQRDCTRKAETEKVTPRDRTAFLLDCLKAAEAAK